MLRRFRVVSQKLYHKLPAPIVRKLRNPRVQLALRVAVVLLAVGLGVRTYFAIRETQATWYNSSWEYRKRIVINEGMVAGSSNFTNFPVLINIHDNQIIQNSQTDGDDIVFALPNGTKLDHDIEAFDSTSNRITAWVEIPTLKYNEDTILYVYYGNPGATAQESPTGVWDGNHQGVWHFDETSGNHVDSTVNTSDSTGITVSLQGTEVGIADGADRFDGVNDYIGIGDTATLSPSSAVTVEGWVKMSETFDSTSDYIQGVVDKGAYQIFLDKSDGKAKFVVNDNAAQAFTAFDSGFSGSVDTFTVWKGELYAGGNFQSTAGGTACTSCKFVAKWNGSAWVALDGGLSDRVYTLAVWNGQLVAGGLFVSTGGGTACASCVRIARWNGSTWQPFDGGLNSDVRSVTTFNGDLVVGGFFTDTAGGTACASCLRIARWNGSAWVPFDAGFNTYVLGLTVWDGKLVAGGGFTSTGGGTACTSCRRIAQWNGSAWTAFDGGMNLDVRGVTVWDGNLIVVGQFTGTGGGTACAACARIARWSGSAWVPLDAGLNDLVEAANVWNGDLIVIGNFTGTAGGTACGSCSRIARWNGSIWTALDGGLGLDSYALSVWEGNLIAGGAFTSAGTGGTSCSTCRRVAKFSTGNTVSVASTTSSWPPGSWYYLAGVYDGSNLKMYVNGNLETSSATSMTAIEDTTPDLYIGRTHGSQLEHGDGQEQFAGTIDEVRISNTARSADYLKTVFNTIKFPDKPANITTPDGGYWKFDEGAGIKAFDASGNGLDGTLVGVGATTPQWTGSGKFGKALQLDGVGDYVGIGDSAAISPTTGLTVSAWIRPRDAFNSASSYNQGIVDKGAYQLFLDKSDNKAKFVVNDTASNAFAAFDQGLNASVASLTTWNGNLVAGGTFTSTGGGTACTNCVRVAQWDGSSWNSFGSGANSTVNALTTWNGDLVVGGLFTATLGPTCSSCARIARWNGSWNAFDAGLNAGVSALAVWNENLYAGGSFTSTAGGTACTTCDGAARWNGAAWVPLDAGLNGAVNALVVWNGNLYAGGSFTSTNGGTACANCSRVAMWNGTSWTALDAGLNSTVRSLGVWNGNLYAGGDFSSTNGGTACANCSRVAMWNGTSWTALSGGMSGNYVLDLAVWNNELYAIGNFTSAAGCPNCVNLAKWDGSTWTALDTGIVGESDALAVWNGKLILGGGFTSIGGTTQCSSCKRIASWSTTNTVSVASTTNSWKANNWYHLTGVYDGSNLKMYVNGNLESSSATSMTAMEDTSGDLFIGKTHGSQMAGGSGELFSGTLDDVRVYGSGKNANFIQQLFAGGDPDVGPISFLESFGLQEQQDTSPVAYWKFDEGTDDTCRDGSSDTCDSMGAEAGSANDGVRSGALWTEESLCIFGKCLYFDGTDDVVTVTNNPSIDLDESLNQALTISGWIRPNSSGEGGTGQVFQKGTNTYIRLANEDAGKADLEVSLGLATPATISVVDGITLNRWTHVAVTWANDGDDEVTVYIDGVARGTSTDGAGDPASDANNLLIGGTTTANFKGYIDEFKVFDVQKTADLVKTLFLKGAAGAAAFGVLDTGFLNDGLKGYWKLDEVAPNVCSGGQDYCDSSGNGFHGTATGIGNTAPGKFNWGAPFDGTDDYIDMGDIDL